MSISRRRFILYTAAGASLASYPVLASPKKKVGVALLGLGYYSSILAPAFAHTKHCELKGIITGSPEKIPGWQSRYGISDKSVYSYENMASIANNDDIDVVYVVTPTATHLKFAELAARAGKHVWCEKPMAMSVDECQKMIDVCKQNKVKLSIGYRMQHEPNTRAFAEYATTRPFGAMKGISSYSGFAVGPGEETNWRMIPEMGGGVLYDLGVYPINGVRFITGLEPVAIKARIEKHEDFKRVDPSTYFTMKFANGVEADCGVSWVKGYNHLKLECEKGWYELNPMMNYSGVAGRTSSGLELPPFKGNQQANQMDNDALAILSDTPVMVPGENGLEDIRVVQKAFESARTDQDFVEI